MRRKNPVSRPNDGGVSAAVRASGKGQSKESSVALPSVGLDTSGGRSPTPPLAAAAPRVKNTPPAGSCAGGEWDACSKKALVFTMDSIQSRVDESKQGGASGEITIRVSLQKGLRDLGVGCKVARSDAEFEREAQNMDRFDLVFLDPWTWAGKGWVLKPFLRGHERKIFILDFFGGDGHAKLNPSVPLTRHLTAFPVNPKNTFLGYWIGPEVLARARAAKTEVESRGVVWGKDSKYYPKAQGLLRAVADISPVVSTAMESALPRHPNASSLGHLSPDNWQRTLATSKFMVGLGDPLVGPSAIDALVAGAMYLNPHYEQPKLGHYTSQHPFAEATAPDHVCGFDLAGADDFKQLKKCVQRALDAELEPIIPKELTREEYVARLRAIFDPVLK